MSQDYHTKDKIHSICISITNQIRSSSLNYSIQETQFSLYFTVRKSLSKSPQVSPSRSNIPCEELESVGHDLKTQCDSLQKENSALKNSLEEAFIESQNRSKHSEVLEKKTQSLQLKLAKIESETVGAREEATADATKALQGKHENLC